MGAQKPRPQQAPPDSLDEPGRPGRGMQQSFERPHQVFLPDGLPGLFRCPRGEGAPVGSLAHPFGQGRRQLVIGLTDLQIADHSVPNGDDAIHVRQRRRGRHGVRLPHVGLRAGGFQVPQPDNPAAAVNPQVPDSPLLAIGHRPAECRVWI